MKILLILFAFLLAGCEVADEPKIEACRVGRTTGWGIRIFCIEGFKFVSYIGAGQGSGITQLFGADGKPVTCNCKELK